MLINSSEAKASRVIIYKFPVKLPFPVYSGLQRASTSRHVHSDGVPGWPAFHHVRMCQHVFALYSALTTALDSDERWLEARKRKDKATYVREKTLRSGEIEQTENTTQASAETVELSSLLMTG